MASSTELAIQRMRRNQEKLKAKLDRLHEEFGSGKLKEKSHSFDLGKSPYSTRKRARTRMLTPDTSSRSRPGSKTYPLKQATNFSSLEPPEVVPQTPFAPTLTRRSGILTPTPSRAPPHANDTIPALNDDDEISRTMMEHSLTTLSEPTTPTAKKAARRLSSTPKGKGKNEKMVSFAETEEHSSVQGESPSEDTVSLSTISGSVDNEDSTSEPLVDHSLERAIFHTSDLREKRGRIGGHNRLNVSFTHGSQDSTIDRTLRKPKSLQEHELLRTLRSSRTENLNRSVKSLRSAKKLLDYSAIDPTLGYDWIAGAVDAEEVESVIQESDQYYNSIKEFRRVNRDECVRPKVISPLTSITPKTKRKYLSLDSGCDHDKTSNATSYILNERLFPVPMHKFEEEGHCPVCEGPNDPDSEKEPTRFIRVSVPRVSLQSPHKWSKRYKRRTSDLTESMGLSQHCQPGWESARPVIVPSQDTVDLSSSLIQGPPGSRGVSEDLLNISRTATYRHKKNTNH